MRLVFCRRGVCLIFKEPRQLFLTPVVAFFACFFTWPFTARFGRRSSIALASLIFCVGAIVQVLNTHSLAAFYVARVVSGVGVGMATVLIPMFSAEMAP